MIEYIREQLSKEELLCQLAEEASELAQAALKLRRVYAMAPIPHPSREAKRSTTSRKKSQTLSWF